MLLTVSCSKELELEGTTWTGSYSTTYEGAESTTTNACDIKMNFTSQNSGRCDVIYTDTWGESGETTTYTDSVTFTFEYSINGKAVSITWKSLDDPEILYITGVVNDDYDEMTISIGGKPVVLKKQK